MTQALNLVLSFLEESVSLTFAIRLMNPFSLNLEVVLFRGHKSL